MNRSSPLVLAMACVALVVLGSAWLVWDRQQSDWDAQDPGLVVVISDTEVATTSTWSCNEQRMRVESSSDTQLTLVLELLDTGAFKLCGAGDCGVSMSPPSLLPERVDPSSCRIQFVLDEPIEDRELIVRCPASDDCTAPVQDSRQ